MASTSKSQVAHLYQTVIEDVITNVRETFLDDGVDEQVLQELKQIWESKLNQTKAVDSPTIGDRAARPQMYTFLPQAKPNQVVYQAMPAQTLQDSLSVASQQGRMAVPDIVYQQGRNIVLPTQTQQIYTSYQPVRMLPQQSIQLSQQIGPSAGSTQTIVLASTSQASKQQQQNSGKPSAIIQVDGSQDSPEEEGPSTSGSAESSRKKSQTRRKKVGVILQVDGRGDSSSSDEDVDNDDDDDDEDDDDDDEDEETKEEEEKVDEEPLCSDDDDSDQDANELFDTENVVVCQYDKIHRAKAKWKFNLKVGIMNLKGKDHVFQKANGEADW